MRVNVGISFACGLIAIAIGVAISVMLSDIATVKAGWCDARPACLRDWIGALSGWAAAAGALATIWVLWATLVHMRNTAEQQLRAYVHIDRSDVEASDNGSPLFRLSVKNFGQTPAVRAQLRGEFHLIGGEKFFRICPIAPRGLSVLPPQYSTLVTFRISPDDFVAWKASNPDSDGLLRLQLSTAVTDVFGKTWRTDGVYTVRASNAERNGPLMVEDVSPEWNTF